jgi:hypothetical protein
MPNPIAELLSRPIPKKLWHYTSIQGFQGIVTSGSIYATDLRFLNDREEFTHARNIADGIVAAAPELDAKGFPNKEILAKAVTVAFDTGPLRKSQVFVASFSAEEDQLGQWRGYSRGSSGVSLGFDLRTLRPPSDTDTLVAFAPCEYDSGRKQELVLDALHHFKEEVLGYWEDAFSAATGTDAAKPTSSKAQVVKDFLDSNPEKKAPFKRFLKAATKTQIDCLPLAALLKNSSFEEEHEWRLVLPTLIDRQASMKHPPRFRAEKSTLVPYIDFAFPGTGPLPLIDVILGPGSDDNSLFAAQRFLKLQGLDVTPRLSKVPYRAL